MDKQTTHPGLKKESAAVLGIFISIFLTLALVSHYQNAEKNWCGVAGQLISEVLIGFLGRGSFSLAAFLLPLS